jgi:hypothetical protein
VLALADFVCGDADARDVVRLKERGAIFRGQTLTCERAVENWLDVGHCFYEQLSKI